MIPYQVIGTVSSSQGVLYEVCLSNAMMGGQVRLLTEYNQESWGEIVSIQSREKCLVMPYQKITGINTRTKVFFQGPQAALSLSSGLLGRVVDFQGKPIDHLGPIEGEGELRESFGTPINPLERVPIKEPIDAGINAINGFATFGKGQRIAIMAGSGVGKSVALGMSGPKNRMLMLMLSLSSEREEGKF